jgi:hypothetical protein
VRFQKDVEKERGGNIQSKSSILKIEKDKKGKKKD